MKQMILIGFMGSGKTTIGKMLAEKLQLPFVDLDQKITEEIGEISTFFENLGEAAFREVERSFLKKYQNEACVLATGGGIIEDEENRKVLSACQNVVFLKVSLACSQKRISQDQQNKRPLARDASVLENLYRKRQPLYQEVANFEVEVSERSVGEIVDEILKKC